MPEQRLAALTELPPRQLEDAASVLQEALAHTGGEYADIRAARKEVDGFVTQRDRVSISVSQGDHVVAWIGAIPIYGGLVWELHPLVVHPEHQRRGLGSLLVNRLERLAKANGVQTLYVGTDDEFGGTNLFGADLYPDIIGKLQNLDVRPNHPVGFYRRLGFVVAGVLPDANGPGRPDIFMAKRIA
jgi:aminoglycoside 6'-N-acetyltransferase I